MDRAPHIIPVPRNHMREGRGFLAVAEGPYKRHCEGPHRPGWAPLAAASSSLGHSGPQRSQEPPWLGPASCLCEGAVAGRWQWDGCHRVILARAMEPRVSLRPERCCRMAGHHASSGRMESPSPPTQLCWEGNFRLLPASQQSGEVSSLALLSQLTRLSQLSL